MSVLFLRNAPQALHFNQKLLSDDSRTQMSSCLLAFSSKKFIYINHVPKLDVMQCSDYIGRQLVSGFREQPVQKV